MAKVTLENIYKSFPARSPDEKKAVSDSADGAPSTTGVSVLRRINLAVEDGEFVVLVGPSGCGKSTLLRLIAGLETATGGNIWVGDQLVNQLPPKQRNIAMVFQNYALYPHMTVYENLAFGLRRSLPSTPPSPTASRSSLPVPVENLLVSATRQLPKSLRYWSPKEREIDQRVRTVAQMLQIDGLLNRLPRQLSGGQKQRVALGRAIARNPQVFLMDEPLSNLDAKLRTETRTQIVQLQRQLGTTTIYVTHDQVEAMTMGDRIAIMNGGQIQQFASPLELYKRPANRFVAGFIGSPPMNFIPVQAQMGRIVHPQFQMTLGTEWDAILRQYEGRSLSLGIRPEHLGIGVAAAKNLPVTVERVENLGSETLLLVDLPSPEQPTRLNVRVDPDKGIHLSDQLWLTAAPDKIHLFDSETELALYPA